MIPTFVDRCANLTHHTFTIVFVDFGAECLERPWKCSGAVSMDRFEAGRPFHVARSQHKLPGSHAARFQRGPQLLGCGLGRATSHLFLLMKAGSLDGSADAVRGQRKQLSVGLRELPERQRAGMHNSHQPTAALERDADERLYPASQDRADDLYLIQIVDDHGLVARRDPPCDAASDRDPDFTADFSLESIRCDRRQVGAVGIEHEDGGGVAPQCRSYCATERREPSPQHSGSKAQHR